MKDYNYKPSDVELEFDWLITNQCNFYCQYCYPPIRKNVKKSKNFQFFHVKDLVKKFDLTGKICHLILSGGEPFLYPSFIEFLEEFTLRHYASIYTNFSLPTIWEFGERIKPTRIPNIFPALHITERERLGKRFTIEEFAEKFVFLMEKEFNVHAIYVLYPPLLDRFKEDFARLQLLGVNQISVKVYKGRYKGILYPEGYTKGERDKIEKLEKVANSAYPQKTKKFYLKGRRNFYGLPCEAGRSFLKIDANGDIFRCASINDYRGNIYDDGPIQLDELPQPCTAHRVLTLTNCLTYLVDNLE